MSFGSVSFDCKNVGLQLLAPWLDATGAGGRLKSGAKQAGHT